VESGKPVYGLFSLLNIQWLVNIHNKTTLQPSTKEIIEADEKKESIKERNAHEILLNQH
jgi:hypothetical protein